MRFFYIAENSYEQVKIWLKLFDPVQKPAKQIIYLWSSIEALLLIVHGVPMGVPPSLNFLQKKTHVTQKKNVGETANFKNKNISQFRDWSQKYPEKSPGGKALFLFSENFNKSPHRYEVHINACGFKISWFQTERKREKNTAIPRWR